MGEDYKVALNFFPFLDQVGRIRIFRKIALEEERPFPNCKKYKLPKNQDESYESYWVIYESCEDFEEYDCDYRTNIVLTLNYYFNKIVSVTKEHLESKSFESIEKFNNRIYYNIENFDEGKRQVYVQPYFLKKNNKFGILLGFRFKNESNQFNRRIQQLSLSLDSDFRSNTSYYSDKYWMIGKFIKNDFLKIFNDIDGLKCISKFEELKSSKLDIKNYILRNGESNSQYQGIKKFKPLKPVKESLSLYFIYLKGKREYAIRLIEALKGQSYPNIFSGLNAIFELQIAKVKGASLDSFSDEAILTTIEKIKELNGKVIPIVILNKKNIDKEENKDYFRLKYLFVNNNIPIQVVTEGLIDNHYSFKYSIVNIGLQIFSKAGGIPWKVKARNDNCLIVGIGKSYKWEETEEERIIKHFYAYSVLVDSSGIFKSIDVISDSEDEEDYYSGIREGIINTIKNNQETYDKIVIHTPFKVRQREIESIRDALEHVKQSINVELVVLKINTDNKYFGFFKKLNSLVPYESSFTNLSENEYLVWFEGSQYHNKRIQKRIGGPTHIKIIYSSNQLDVESKESYLQDTINLSGANWRGFNSKALPVSVYYCQIISKFLNEFDGLNYNKVKVQNLNPWFI